MNAAKSRQQAGTICWTQWKKFACIRVPNCLDVLVVVIFTYCWVFWCANGRKCLASCLPTSTKAGLYNFPLCRLCLKLSLGVARGLFRSCVNLQSLPLCRVAAPLTELSGDLIASINSGPARTRAYLNWSPSSLLHLPTLLRFSQRKGWSLPSEAFACSSPSPPPPLIPHHHLLPNLLTQQQRPSQKVHLHLVLDMRAAASSKSCSPP